MHLVTVRVWFKKTRKLSTSKAGQAYLNIRASALHDMSEQICLSMDHHTI